MILYNSERISIDVLKELKEKDHRDIKKSSSMISSITSLTSPYFEVLSSFFLLFTREVLSSCIVGFNNNSYSFTKKAKKERKLKNVDYLTHKELIYSLTFNFATNGQ